MAINRWWVRLGKLAVVVAFTAATVALQPQSAFGYGPSGAYWPTSHVGTYCAGPGLISQGWLGFLQTSVGKWNGVAGFTHPVFNYTGCSGYDIGVATYNGGAAGPCGTNTNQGPNGTNMNGYIDHAETRVNVQQTFSTSTGAACNIYYTFEHEIGHAEGMRHSCIADAVMFKRNNDRTVLTQDDVFGYKWRYVPAFSGPPYPDDPPCD